MSEEAVSRPLEAPEAVSGAVEPSGPVEPSNLETISSQMAYERFLGAAKALEPGELEECRGDVVLTYYNVKRGVESVLGSAPTVIGKLPEVNVEELSMLPLIAQGLAFAALQMQRELRVASFGTLFERAQNLRRKLNKTAEALAEAGLLPAADYESVQLNGRLDVMEDCLALVALFRKHEGRVSGRSPVSPGDVNEAEQVSRKLRAMIGQPGEVGEGGVPPLVKATEMRDRFWTLLNRRHDLLWRCGAWLFGRGVDERVPPLLAKQAVVRRVQPVVVEREVRTQSRALLSPPSLSPVRGSPSPGGSSQPSRHLSDLDRMTLERKTRFLVRIGVLPRGQE